MNIKTEKKLVISLTDFKHAFPYEFKLVNGFKFATHYKRTDDGEPCIEITVNEA